MTRPNEVTPIPKPERKPKAQRRPLNRVAKRAKTAAWSSLADLALAKTIVRERSGGWCEANEDGCLGRATNVHHRAGRGFKGCHHPDLLLDCCGNGNLSGCHGAIHADRERGEAWGHLLPWGTTADRLDEFGQLRRDDAT